LYLFFARIIESASDEFPQAEYLLYEPTILHIVFQDGNLDFWNCSYVNILWVSELVSFLHFIWTVCATVGSLSISCAMSRGSGSGLLVWP